MICPDCKREIGDKYDLYQHRVDLIDCLTAQRDDLKAIVGRLRDDKLADRILDGGKWPATVTYEQVMAAYRAAVLSDPGKEQA